MPYELVPLPRGMPPGAVVGRRGRNIKWLMRRSGAQITVDEGGVHVNAGTQETLALGVQVVSRQLQANVQSGSPAYPHPGRVYYILLEGAVGPSGHVRFQPRADEVARAAERKESLFALAPGAAAPGSSGHTAINPNTAAATTTGASTTADAPPAADFAAATSVAAASPPPPPVTASGADVIVHSIRALGGVASALSSAVVTATGLQQPSFHIVKLRLNLGTQLFYNLGRLAASAALNPDCLQGIGSRAAGKVRSVYSNLVPAAAVQRITAWLTGQRGFVAGPPRTTAKLHIINQELNVHYSVSLLVEADGEAVSLEKIETSTTKCHFVSLLSGQRLDLRIKLEGLYGNVQDPVALEVAEVVVAACRRVGLTAFMDCPSRHLPPNRHLYVDVVRKRTRTLYSGTVQAPDGSSHRLEVVAQSTVEAGEHARNHRGVAGGQDGHWELRGALPDVDADLARMLVAAAAGEEEVKLRAEEAGAAAGTEESRAGDPGPPDVLRAEAQAAQRPEAASNGGGGDPGGGFSPARAEGVLGALAGFVGALNEHLEGTGGGDPGRSR